MNMHSQDTLSQKTGWWVQPSLSQALQAILVFTEVLEPLAKEKVITQICGSEESFLEKGAPELRKSSPRGNYSRQKRVVFATSGSERGHRSR